MGSSLLIETNNENDFTSFRTKDIDSFVTWYSENINEEKINTLRQAMDKFEESLDKVSITTVSLPMVLYSGYRVLRDKKSFTKLIEIVNNFVTNYETNDEYKQYCSSGTTSSDKVRGRLDYWKKLIGSL